MNMAQIARLILVGEMGRISENARVEIIRLVLASCRGAVEYLPAGTTCPVCAKFGLAGDVRITSTRGEVRSCWCRRCTATFTAIGPLPADIPKPEPEPPPPPRRKRRR